MIYSHEYIYYGVALEKSDNFLYNQKKKMIYYYLLFINLLSSLNSNPKNVIEILCLRVFLFN